MSHTPNKVSRWKRALCRIGIHIWFEQGLTRFGHDWGYRNCYRCDREQVQRRNCFSGWSGWLTVGREKESDSYEVSEVVLLGRGVQNKRPYFEGQQR